MRTLVATLSFLGLLALPVLAQAQTVETPQAAPYLVVSKLPATAETQPGKTILFTVTVKNEGSEVAKSLKLNDALPSGFSFKENGKEILDRTFLNDLHPGEKFSASYEVVVGKDVEAGTYENRATVSAANHGAVQAQSSVIVTVPQVKGEQTQQRVPQVKGETALPETGTPVTTVIALAIAFGLLVLGGALITLAQGRERQKSPRA